MPDKPPRASTVDVGVQICSLMQMTLARGRAAYTGDRALFADGVIHSPGLEDRGVLVVGRGALGLGVGRRIGRLLVTLVVGGGRRKLLRERVEVDLVAGGDAGIGVLERGR